MLFGVTTEVTLWAPIEKLQKSLKHESHFGFLLHANIEWKFKPEHASHFGGI